MEGTEHSTVPRKYEPGDRAAKRAAAATGSGQQRTEGATP